MRRPMASFTVTENRAGSDNGDRKAAVEKTAGILLL